MPLAKGGGGQLGKFEKKSTQVNFNEIVSVTWGTSPGLQKGWEQFYKHPGVESRGDSWAPPVAWGFWQPTCPPVLSATRSFCLEGEASTLPPGRESGSKQQPLGSSQTPRKLSMNWAQNFSFIFATVKCQDSIFSIYALRGVTWVLGLRHLNVGQVWFSWAFKRRQQADFAVSYELTNFLKATEGFLFSQVLSQAIITTPATSMINTSSMFLLFFVISHQLHNIPGRGARVAWSLAAWAHAY